MINLYINERRTGEVTVLDLKGKLRIGGNSLALHRSVRSLVAEKKNLILLNLSGVTYIDSCGLGELVASQVSVENSGGEIKLTGLSDKLRELFTATRLLAVFDIYADEAEAILDFNALGSKLEKPALAFA
jgi:anti-sigma B factor antagonist